MADADYVWNEMIVTCVFCKTQIEGLKNASRPEPVLHSGWCCYKCYNSVILVEKAKWLAGGKNWRKFSLPRFLTISWRCLSDMNPYYALTDMTDSFTWAQKLSLHFPRTPLLVSVMFVKYGFLQKHYSRGTTTLVIPGMRGRGGTKIEPHKTS